MGRVDVMRCMVTELGADVNLADNGGPTCTPLFLAAKRGRVDMVRGLAELGADLNRVPEDDGLTLLHMSALDGHLDLVRCLILEFGADVNKRGLRGATPLYCAAQNGHIDVVRYLVEKHGADVNQATHNGQTPLMVATRYAARNKDNKLVRCLIKLGADVQASTAQRANAVDVSRSFGASAAQTEYLEAKAHCSNPGCSGAGLKKCTGCKKVRYCGQACQLAHWKAHKAACSPD
jgi:ankyrin repeat protein